MTEFRTHKDGKAYPLHIHVHTEAHETRARKEMDGHQETEGPSQQEDQWYQANGTLHGWHVSQSEEQRREEVLKTAREEGYARTYHKLIGLANVTTDPRTERAAREDYRWLARTHSEELHRSLEAERSNLSSA
ncbi:MAG: hypothetical protein JRN73_09980 [Nitrososphaerota archaeon]|nr:hypothetical protein [Nitrososphaerota archaeon]MDG7018665.1 hypothetical protein [Nitrososphaerota archaeon]MDG7019991.1 hypothetical protein [Nitrososphaerota archaeon]